jgi:hypothetical protein
MKLNDCLMLEKKQDDQKKKFYLRFDCFLFISTVLFDEWSSLSFSFVQYFGHKHVED